MAQSEWQLTVDSASEVEDDEFTDSRDATAVRQIETVELRLDGREVCTSDGRRGSAAGISTTVPLPETERTAE